MTEYTLCEPKFIDMEFMSEVDKYIVWAVLVALGDDDPADLEPLGESEPDSLQRRLVGWGWSVLNHWPRLHVYGDYTALEQDAVVLPALAPFLHPLSKYVYEPKDGYGYEGWSFGGGVARRRKAEREVQFYWTTP